MLSFAFDGVTSFSVKPLRMISVLVTVCAVFSIGGLIYVVRAFDNWVQTQTVEVIISSIGTYTGSMTDTFSITQAVLTEAVLSQNKKKHCYHYGFYNHDEAVFLCANSTR